MCARVLACPLCSQPGFLTLDALRAGLVSVATRPLICPVCNEVLLGIDKLTIHLFGHTINLNNATAESSKSADIAATDEHLVAIHNAHKIAPQDWNILKQLNKVESGNNRICTEPSDSVVPNVGNIPAIDSQLKIQSLDSSTKGTSQSSFVSDYNRDVIKVNILPQSNGNHNTVQKVITHLQQETNCAMQYFCNDIKHLNVSQEAIQAEKTAISDLIIATKVAGTVDINIYQDIEKECIESNSSVLKEKLITDLVEEEHDLPNFQSVQNIITNVCARKSPEERNDKEDLPNAKNTILETNIGDQNQNLEHKQILPHTQTNAKAIHTIAPKEKTERCNLCGFYFPDTNILALHEKLVHEQDSSNNPEKVLKNYSCYLCSKVFKMRGSLMVHMRVAHIGHNSGSFSKGDQNEVTCGDAGYACPTCGKKFKKEQHVIQHLKTHEGKQWECDTCSKMFTTKYFLKKHKRLHSGEMPYKCKICDKSFTFQQSYHKHRLYHKDDKPHTCATCGRSFKELSTLHNHERIHTGEKPFVCETCGKCFRQRVSYLVHRRIHTGVMPYKCTMCGKSFRYKVSQRTHKCPVQTLGSTQQLISDTREADNSTVRSQVTDTLQENQSITNTDEENKFVLIINAQGQPVLALQSEINNISSKRKEQGIEFTDASNTNEDLKSKTWGDDLNSTGLEESAELIERVQSDNEKIDAKSTNDFFSMVMSPLETSISSSTFEMEHLRVSSPKHKEDPIDSYTDFPQISGNVQMNLEPDIEQNFSHNKDVTESLQTINEESLKELLYGMDRK
ncbi:PREDICTED: zinc finger protein 836 isoform X1 [Trachymyrmex cornetzi]|uniref:zinc finger protein 836 isoform X1 n=1 Tax=Trachymyrmex cornetzi TaxID=471704 RepID=UPI00084F3F01|nr:PREDICTED: zinc finger protein 836 isoform X1 [Trachymyrmex cornetzi]